VTLAAGAVQGGAPRLPLRSASQHVMHMWSPFESLPGQLVSRHGW